MRVKLNLDHSADLRRVAYFDEQTKQMPPVWFADELKIEVKEAADDLPYIFIHIRLRQTDAKTEDEFCILETQDSYYLILVIDNSISLCLFTLSCLWT